MATGAADAAAAATAAAAAAIVVECAASPSSVRDDRLLRALLNHGSSPCPRRRWRLVGRQNERALAPLPVRSPDAVDGLRGLIIVTVYRTSRLCVAGAARGFLSAPHK